MRSYLLNSTAIARVLPPLSEAEVQGLVWSLAWEVTSPEVRARLNASGLLP
jgi:hypothetical protein